MAPLLDLLILPLARSGGQDQPSVPGLLVAVPPRRPARFRERDQLCLYLILEGNAPLSLDQLSDLLENLAKTYYRTTGSVTTAQRAVAESINEFLLERNLRNASSENQAIGLFTQVVLRENQLYIAQSGLVYAIMLRADGVEQIHDPNLAGPGLGINRATSLRYAHTELQVNEALILTSQPPASWTANVLQVVQGQGPESLRRRLLSQAGPELNAALFQAQTGTGQLRLLRPVRSMRPRPSQPTLGQPAPIQPSEPQTMLDISAEPIELQSPPDQAARITPPLVAASMSVEHTPKPISPEPAPTWLNPPPPPVEAAPASESSQPVTRTSPKKSTSLTRLAGFSAIGATIGNALRSAGRTLGSLAKNVLPDESIFTIPASTMAFVAVAVPLIVVAIAGFVYFQRGRAAQFEAYFAEAQAAAADAQTKIDPQDQRSAWESTLVYLNQAETYQTTLASQNLRAQAQSILDTLDSVERLDFKPAIIGGLEETANIGRMVSIDNDLYLLNDTNGVVLRAIFTNQGYRLDPTFKCGPGLSGGFIVGAIKDIAALPKGNEMNAAILGIDANGNLLYCIPAASPLAKPMQPPDTNWGTPQGLAVDGGDLYILDPQTNAVWIYRDMDVTSQPRLFFGEQVPSMQDMIDMAVNQNDLYLLHADGRLAYCVFSGFVDSPTRCEDPAAFTDARPGRVSGPLIEAATFSEIQFSPPPDPSIYLLDPISQALYNFSVRLTFDRQYRSQNPLPEGQATAFAVNKGERTIFMAVGNQVYYAALP